MTRYRRRSNDVTKRRLRRNIVDVLFYLLNLFYRPMRNGRSVGGVDRKLIQVNRGQDCFKITTLLRIENRLKGFCKEKCWETFMPIGIMTRQNGSRGSSSSWPSGREASSS